VAEVGEAYADVRGFVATDVARMLEQPHFGDAIFGVYDPIWPAKREPRRSCCLGCARLRRLSRPAVGARYASSDRRPVVPIWFQTNGGFGLSTAFAEADLALYEGKHAGRNRVRTRGSPPERETAARSRGRLGRRAG
jgi:hypothetical protein